MPEAAANTLTEKSIRNLGGFVKGDHIQKNRAGAPQLTREIEQFSKLNRKPTPKPLAKAVKVDAEAMGNGQLAQSK